MTDMQEKLDFIKKYDPEGADKLTRLLERKTALKEGNVYGEKFTDRQFSLVFDPLLAMSLEKARILEALQGGDDTVRGLSAKLGLREDLCFRHLKELMRRNRVEISGHVGRDASFRTRA
ncbi:MAG TPA: hypothetical protein VGJ94_14380 [Syntrophorhabdaceae bacterium]|jgi:hypothetical protein